tara:strand:- start:177 stop:539 length:363 start_codon:yes stop_codon:yes gene_type:complete
MASVIASVSIDDTQDVQDSFIEESTIEDIMELMFENDGYSFVTVTVDDVEIELEAENFEFGCSSIGNSGSAFGSIELEIPMSDLQQALRDKVQELRNEIHDLNRQATFAEVVDAAKKAAS